MITESQRAERLKYIGSSDAAAVLGLSRWSTPLEIWALKTGQIQSEDISDRLAIEVGNELEDLVAKLFTKRTGKQVRRVNETFYHSNYSFLAANIDRRVVGEDTILEAKTCSGWKAKEWTGEAIPQEYLIQVMHQLAVTGKERAYVAVLIGGNQDFVYKLVERDEKLISDMVRKESEFWVKYVEPKVMPTIVTKNDGGVLYKLFPDGIEGQEVNLGDDANAVIESLEAMGADLANMEGTIEQQRNVLKLMLGNNENGNTGRYKVTWKNQNTARLDIAKLKEEAPEVVARFTKTTPSRVLRFRKLKGEPA